MARITKNFDEDEFKCPCCGEEHMDRAFVQTLQVARDEASIPFHINSGWRCEKHNRAVGGITGSSHSKGLAADIKIRSKRERWIIVGALKFAGLNRFGLGKGFIHVDADSDKTPRLIWIY